MMKKTLAASSVALLLCSGAAVAADDMFSANVAIVSDYAYRGYTQTDEEPALQGGFDFAHDSGFYIGVWGSNVQWLSSVSNNSLELDIYAGYATEVGPLGVDVGLLQYYYPGSYDKGVNSPDTLELYVGLSYDFVSFTYSYSFTDLFGIDNSDGSQYFDLSAGYEVADGVSLEAHYGYSDIAGTSDADYADWKVGVTAGLAGFDFGLHYVDTDADGCKDVCDERIILSIGRSF